MANNSSCKLPDVVDFLALISSVLCNVIVMVAYIFLQAKSISLFFICKSNSNELFICCKDSFDVVGHPEKDILFKSVLWLHKSFTVEV